MREREEPERADRGDRHREHDHERGPIGIVERDHQQIDEHDREEQRPAEALNGQDQVLLRSAGRRADDHGIREMQRLHAGEEVALHVREEVAGLDVRADVDHRLAIHPRDQRLGRRVHQGGNVAEVHDRARSRTQRDRVERLEARLVGNRVEYLHVLGAIGGVELGRERAAERCPHGGRGRTDVHVERPGAIAVELDVDLRREAHGGAVDVGGARRVAQRAEDLLRIRIRLATCRLDRDIDRL